MKLAGSERPILFGRVFVNGFQIARSVQIDAAFGSSPQHQAPAAHVVETCGWIEDHVHRR